MTIAPQGVSPPNLYVNEDGTLLYFNPVTGVVGAVEFDASTIAPVSFGNASAGGRWDPRDGYMEQWGESDTIITAEGAGTVSFPEAFDTCTGFYAWALDPGNQTDGTLIQPGSYSATQGNYRVQDNASGSVANAGGYRWTAKGYRGERPS